MKTGVEMLPCPLSITRMGKAQPGEAEFIEFMIYEWGKRFGFEMPSLPEDHEYSGVTITHPAATGSVREAAIQSLVSAWHGGWSYDFGPHNVPSGPIEVAFDAGLGYTHVKICERFITRSMATYDRPLPLDQYEYGYRDQGGKDVSDGRRPYAWRKIALPPHPYPFADDQPRDVETFIHNHCPDKVRDHFAALTVRAALAAAPTPDAAASEAAVPAGEVVAWLRKRAADFRHNAAFQKKRPGPRARGFEDAAMEIEQHFAAAPKVASGTGAGFVHGMTAKTEVDRIAILLFETFAKVEPREGITLYHASYWATFADMARAVIADRAALTTQGGAEG